MGKHPENKHERVEIEKHKIKQLAENHRNDWCSPAYFDEDKQRYVKTEKGSHADRYRYHKIQSNKKLRRAKIEETDGEFIDEVPSGKRNYQKMYDYWWEVG